LRVDRELRTVFTLGLLAAIPALAINMALSVPEQLVLSFDASASVARLFVTLYLAGYAIALIPMGIGCDVFPRKWFVLSCLLAFAALGLLASTSDSLVTILLVRFVQGVLGAACAVGARAIIRDIAGVDIAKSMTSMMIILALSPSVGPLLGGQFLSWLGFRGPLFAMAIYAVLTAMLLVILVPSTRETSRTKNSGFRVFLQAREFFSSRSVTLPLALVAIPFSAYLVMLSGLSEIMNFRYDYSAATFGSTFAGIALAYPLATWIGRRLQDYWTSKRVMGCGVVLFLVSLSLQVGYLASFEPHQGVLWGAVGFYLGGLGLVVPVATALVMDSSPTKAGFSAAVIGTAQFTLGTLGSAFYAVLSDGQGTILLTTMATAVVLIMIVFSFFISVGAEAYDKGV
jgi:MFS transporter, DHA1 family, multidrug resistance protein